MTAPTRPALRWHGGKWLLAPWIISHFPKHYTYVEPYGGAASVLLRKPRCHSEIYNDLNGEVVNLFKVLRDPAMSEELIHLIALTPFSRAEFQEAYLDADNPVEGARRLVIRCFQGFGSDGHNRDIRTGFRSNGRSNGASPSVDWMRLPDSLKLVAERFRGVVIEKDDALLVCARYDRHDTLHYLDPPYVPETRSQKSKRGQLRYHAYSHEMTDEDHAELLDRIQDLEGPVVLSGYNCDLYAEKLAGWKRVDKTALADGARARVESLWLNRPAAVGSQQVLPGMDV